MSKHVDINDIKIKLITLNSYYCKTIQINEVKQIVDLIDSLSFDCSLLFKQIVDRNYPKRVLVNNLWLIKTNKSKKAKYIKQVYLLDSQIRDLIKQIFDKDFNKQAFEEILFQKIDQYQQILQTFHQQIG